MKKLGFLLSSGNDVVATQVMTGDASGLWIGLGVMFLGVVFITFDKSRFINN